ALQAFALAIAPLPDVTLASNAPAPDYQRMDGTFAIDWINRHLDELTPAQRSAVDAALTPQPVALTLNLPPGVAVASTQDQYLAALSTADDVIAAHLGRHLPKPYDLTINNRQQEYRDGQPALAYATAADSTATVGCHIFVEPA